VRNAKEIVLDGEPARVFRAEHAVAIAVKTNRRKDRERIGHLLETGTTRLNEGALKSLLERFSTPESDLPKRWQALQEIDG
jgi:predicted nucleotidyltransferase